MQKVYIFLFWNNTTMLYHQIFFINIHFENKHLKVWGNLYFKVDIMITNEQKVGTFSRRVA